jgi:hypothetical protein
MLIPFHSTCVWLAEVPRKEAVAIPPLPYDLIKMVEFWDKMVDRSVLSRGSNKEESILTFLNPWLLSK